MKFLVTLSLLLILGGGWSYLSHLWFDNNILTTLGTLVIALTIIIVRSDIKAQLTKASED